MRSMQRTRCLNRALILLTSLFLAGCLGGATVRVDSSANHYLNLVGGHVQLHQPLQIEAGEARVFLQQGRVRGGFNFYAPHCSFEIRNVQHPGVTITPGRFEISRVTHVITEVVQAWPVKVAALFLSGMDGDGISQQFEGYHFRLSSPQQPQVFRMSCFGVHAEPSDLDAPTLREIRETLGSIATLYRIPGTNAARRPDSAVPAG